MMQFLSSIDKLKTARLAGLDAEADSEPLLPVAAQPILNTMAALIAVVKGTMGHGLDPTYKELIANYTARLEALPAHMLVTCGQQVAFTWKEHILTCHLEEWLDTHQEGLAKYSEQASESIHHTFKVRVWQHYKVPPGHAR